MKFLNKINRNYIILFSIVLIMVSFGGYFILQTIILRETKEALLDKEVLIIKQIAETGEIPFLYPIIEVTKTDSVIKYKAEFKEIYIQNEAEAETEPYIEYSNFICVEGTYYSLKLRQSIFENEDLVIILALAIFILLLAAFSISFFINKKINKTVWIDFENNLQEIEKYSFRQNQHLNLTKTDIDEFDRLNIVITKLTEKLRSDYFLLKEFSENASHEIQTPLSIVLLNLEEVLQQDLSEENFKKVVSSINAVKRLSKLNQSLILLTKIENGQFSADNTINLNDIINKKVQEFAPLFEAKKLNIELNYKQEFTLKMNEQLADLLISNLLSNAMNHNYEGGNIIIKTKSRELNICNTGESNTLTDKTIFDRFVKGNSNSYGLGLAIVKNICDTHNLDVRYKKNEFHCFIIKAKYLSSI